MTSEEFVSLLVLATTMSFTPGPNTLLSASLGANLGVRGALRFIVAVPAGWTVMVLATGVGLGALVAAAPGVREALKILGVAYLIWLSARLAFASAPGEGSVRLRIGFWQGVGLQFVNIKAWMLALALVAGWVTSAAGAVPSNPGERLGIVCAVMAVFALTSNSVYAMAGSLLRRWLAQGTRLVWFNRFMGLSLLATALWMLRA